VGVADFFFFFFFLTGTAKLAANPQEETTF
jgi:hypothetical protein